VRRRRAAQAAADETWLRARHAGRRWAVWGAAAGVATALVVFAPATWLAHAMTRATEGRVLLADARGSVWSGSAVAVLQGGPGSLDASALPGRLHWTMAPSWSGLRLSLRHACCLLGELPITVQPRLGGLAIDVPARPQGIGRWPARWLVGLGTPWNTLQLGGTLRLASGGFRIQTADSRMRLTGSLDLDLLGASSRVSTLDPLGSYRLSLSGDPSGREIALVRLDTTEGVLRLSGSGHWSDAGLRLRGEARAAAGHEAGLSNLLNIIGRRQGASSVISIG